MATTAFYAAIAVLFFVFLSARVIGARRTAKVSLGDGGNKTLRRRLRAHGNFAEYVPFAIILMGLAESQAAPDWTLHALGCLLFIGRILHAYSVSSEPEPLQLRVVGMGITFATLVSAALLNLGLFAFA